MIVYSRVYPKFGEVTVHGSPEGKGLADVVWKDGSASIPMMLVKDAFDRRVDNIVDALQGLEPEARKYILEQFANELADSDED